MKGKQTTTRIIWRTGRENVESWAGNEFGTKHKGLVEKRRCKALGVHRPLITFPVTRDYRDSTIRTDVVQPRLTVFTYRRAAVTPFVCYGFFFRLPSVIRVYITRRQPEHDQLPTETCRTKPESKVRIVTPPLPVSGSDIDVNERL